MTRTATAATRRLSIEIDGTRFGRFPRSLHIVPSLFLLCVLAYAANRGGLSDGNGVVRAILIVFVLGFIVGPSRAFPKRPGTGKQHFTNGHENEKSCSA